MFFFNPTPTSWCHNPILRPCPVPRSASKVCGPSVRICEQAYSRIHFWFAGDGLKDEASDQGIDFLRRTVTPSTSQMPPILPHGLVEEMLKSSNEKDGSEDFALASKSSFQNNPSCEVVHCWDIYLQLGVKLTLTLTALPARK